MSSFTRWSWLPGLSSLAVLSVLWPLIPFRFILIAALLTLVIRQFNFTRHGSEVEFFFFHYIIRILELIDQLPLHVH